MSRCSCIELAIIGLVVALLATPTLAMADVLEINGSQSSWIAGGPPPGSDLAVRQLAVSDLAQDTAGPAPAETSSLQLTQFSDTAGPVSWRRRVGELASKYDVSPALLEALVWQESRWRESATSPKGAHGLAQLMPGTARELGVDPRDPAANLEGGARYLRQQLDAFGGDVEKALAAYNAGPGRVRRAGGIPQIAETRAYVSAILGRMNRAVLDQTFLDRSLADPVRR